MADDSEYGEYPGGYTAGYPPHWIRPLLEQYPTLTVIECGYRQGSWANLTFETEDGSAQVKFRREITNDMTVTGAAWGKIPTGVMEKNVKERDVLIGNVLNKRLGGYDSFAEAVEAVF